jgi:hypothetical protein
MDLCDEYACPEGRRGRRERGLVISTKEFFSQSRGTEYAGSPADFSCSVQECIYSKYYPVDRRFAQHVRANQNLETR